MTKVANTIDYKAIHTINLHTVGQDLFLWTNRMSDKIAISTIRDDQEYSETGFQIHVFKMKI